MKLTKKKYERPHVEVFELKHRAQLLAGSALNAPSDYEDGGDPFNPAP